jgi:hypothetical protein
MGHAHACCSAEGEFTPTAKAARQERTARWSFALMLKHRKNRQRIWHFFGYYRGDRNRTGFDDMNLKHLLQSNQHQLLNGYLCSCISFLAFEDKSP